MNPIVFDVLSWSAAAPPATGSDQNNMTPLFLMVLSLGVLFYLLIWGPNRKEQQKRQTMLDSVAKGDTVVTTGGMIGTVESVDAAKGIVTVSVAPKVNIKFTKAAIASITSRKGKGGGEDEVKTS
jgi:preprotein translocase subunit YajC